MEMVDHGTGMPDPPWRRPGRWAHCRPNREALHLALDQAVRLNLRMPPEFGTPVIGRIAGFRIANGQRCAVVQWPTGIETVPLWALVKA
jgi:hypothetical protein